MRKPPPWMLLTHVCAKLHFSWSGMRLMEAVYIQLHAL